MALTFFKALNHKKSLICAKIFANIVYIVVQKLQGFFYLVGEVKPWNKILALIGMSQPNLLNELKQIQNLANQNCGIAKLL